MVQAVVVAAKNMFSPTSFNNIQQIRAPMYFGSENSGEELHRVANQRSSVKDVSVHSSSRFPHYDQNGSQPDLEVVSSDKNESSSYIQTEHSLYRHESFPEMNSPPGAILYSNKAASKLILL